MQITNTNFIDLSAGIECDDDVLAVQLPEESKYAGAWLVWSVSSRGCWIAKAVIVRNLDVNRLIECNPFASVEELKELGFDAIAGDFRADGSDYTEPVVFEIADNETFIDRWGYDDEDDTVEGLYIGPDADDFIESICDTEDDDFED